MVRPSVEVGYATQTCRLHPGATLQKLLCQCAPAAGLKMSRGVTVCFNKHANSRRRGLFCARCQCWDVLCGAPTCCVWETSVRNFFSLGPPASSMSRCSSSALRCKSAMLVCKPLSSLSVTCISFSRALRRSASSAATCNGPNGDHNTWCGLALFLQVRTIKQ